MVQSKKGSGGKKKPAWLNFRPPMNRAAAVGQRKLIHEELWRKLEARILEANLTEDQLAELFVKIEECVRKFVEEKSNAH